MKRKIDQSNHQITKRVSVYTILNGPFIKLISELTVYYELTLNELIDLDQTLSEKFGKIQNERPTKFAEWKKRESL